MGLVLTQELPAGRADSLSGWNNSTNTIAGTVSQGTVKMLLATRRTCARSALRPPTSPL